MRRLARSLFLCALLLPMVAFSAAEQRLVAVGDIHGEYDGFVSILQRAGLIDAKLRWTGGRATFVQVGDYLDRGPHVRKVKDLLMDLERGAAKKRGKTVVLLGNHEVMNLTSVFHDADPAAYAAFADRRSEKRRQAAYAQYVALHARLAERYAREPWPLLDESAWNEKHPLGFVEFQDALRRDFKYGRWLRNRPAAARAGDTVFVHGGISPKAKERTIEEINRKVQLEIEAMDRVREYLVAEKLILPFFTYPEIIAVADLELAREGAMSDDLLRILRAAKSMYQWTI
ncbi:MAG TPA: metallophosphoesterase [Thermoanaerobaculia bacterium]|nr:metallophosphoesterase [Thermoanaerobaculia bacterium]